MVWLGLFGPVVGADSSAPPEPLLKSIYSGWHRLQDFKSADTKAIACVFLDVDCPIARKYLPRLAQMHERLRDQGVVILGIYSSPRVNVWEIAVHAPLVSDSQRPFIAK
jgi:hypothetical protein